MQAILFSKTGDFTEQKITFSTHATIGKAPGNTIEIAAATISKKHARIFFDDEEKCFLIEDLGSKNGTAIDGVRIYEKEKLEKLHVITFAGVYDFIFHIPAKQPLGEAEAPATVAERQTVAENNAFVTPDRPAARLNTDAKQTQFGDTFEE